MAANKNNETESKDIKKPFLQRKKLRGSKYLRKTIDLPVEKVNIMRISTPLFTRRESTRSAHSLNLRSEHTTMKVPSAHFRWENRLGNKPLIKSAKLSQQAM